MITNKMREVQWLALATLTGPSRGQSNLMRAMWKAQLVDPQSE